MDLYDLSRFTALFWRSAEISFEVYNEKSLGISKAFLVGAEGVEPPTLCL